MSEQESLDIGKVIGLIMENPGLIEQISNLARQKDYTPEDHQPKESPTEAQKTEQAAVTTAKPSYASSPHSRGNRAQLLGALKPYVSVERAKAIDSMMSIADILEMMKAR